ncbi:hypothetical protein [Phytohabitans houttuyneae]|uniref:Uncharacterized protein n=1 Tax=Phytohabitans houttuyneae TaxID=1076126 RepID=A0A6V8KA19_9ACTN|nr:hypothetical protein [Phytohabitans houttuyneae]GFJ82063.1 hypothetical protein Phou_062430 [Phytohabitans houttuyneae]
MTAPASRPSRYSPANGWRLVAFFLVHAWPAGTENPAARRLLCTGWTTSIAAAVGTALLFGPYLAGTSRRHLPDGTFLTETLDTRLGHALAVRTALLIAPAP